MTLRRIDSTVCVGFHRSAADSPLEMEKGRISIHGNDCGSRDTLAERLDINGSETGKRESADELTREDHRPADAESRCRPCRRCTVYSDLVSRVWLMSTPASTRTVDTHDVWVKEVAVEAKGRRTEGIVLREGHRRSEVPARVD